jgi:hypothetical protein
MEGIPMTNKKGRNGVTKALIKSKWYEVLQINNATQKAIVVDPDGKEQLVDLRDITNFLTDVSEINGKIVSGKVFKKR